MSGEMLIQGFNNWIATPLKSLQQSIGLDYVFCVVGPGLSKYELGALRSKFFQPAKTVVNIMEYHHMDKAFKSLRKIVKYGGKITGIVGWVELLSKTPSLFKELSEQVKAGPGKRRVICPAEGPLYELKTPELSEGMRLSRKAGQFLGFSTSLGYALGFRAAPVMHVITGLHSGLHGVREEYTGAYKEEKAVAAERYYSFLRMAISVATAVASVLEAGVLCFGKHQRVKGIQVYLFLGIAIASIVDGFVGEYLNDWRARIENSKTTT